MRNIKKLEQNFSVGLISSSNKFFCRNSYLKNEFFILKKISSETEKQLCYSMEGYLNFNQKLRELNPNTMN